MRADRGTVGRARLILTLGALSAFAPLSLDLYLPAFPTMAAELGTDIGAIQLTLSSCLLGLGAGQLLYGPVSDRFGRRTPLLVGLVVYVVASLACAVAPTVGALIALRLVQALGGCAGLVLARAIARDCFEGRALARALTLMGMVSALAPAVAPALGALVLRWGSWRWSFVLLAAFGAACWLAVLALPETLPPERRSPSGPGVAVGSYAIVVRSREFLMPALVVGLCFMALFAYVSSGPAVLMGSYGLGPDAFAASFGAIALCLLLFSRVTLHLLRRAPATDLLPWAVGTQAVASTLVLAAVLLGLPLPCVLIPLAVAIGLVSSISGLALSEALRPFASRAGAASALAGLVQMGSGALVAAGLAALAGPPPLEMSGVMAVSSGVSLVLATRLRRRVSRPAAVRPAG